MLVRAADADKIRRALPDLNGRIARGQARLARPDPAGEDQRAAQGHAGGAGYKELRTFDDHPSAYVALAQNRVDGSAQHAGDAGHGGQGRARANTRSSRALGADNWAGIAVRKEDTEVVAFLNGATRRSLKDDGTIYKLHEKWFGFRMTAAPTSVPSFG